MNNFHRVGCGRSNQLPVNTTTKKIAKSIVGNSIRRRSSVPRATASSQPATHPVGPRPPRPLLHRRRRPQPSTAPRRTPSAWPRCHSVGSPSRAPGVKVKANRSEGGQLTSGREVLHGVDRERAHRCRQRATQPPHGRGDLIVVGTGHHPRGRTEQTVGQRPALVDGR